MPSLDTALSYHRLKKAPLDDREVFTSLRNLMDYCATGASYDGQRVVVVDNNRIVEYTIKGNIPMIYMMGSEPIFRQMTFSGDSLSSYGMLIYEYNMLNSEYSWNSGDIFSVRQGRLCLMSQAEIFRIVDAVGNKTFKFRMVREKRGEESGISETAWNQNFNPYADASSNPVQSSPGVIINKMVYDRNASDGGHLKTNNSSICLMPKDSANAEPETEYITKIYIKAEDYYRAYNNL